MMQNKNGQICKGLFKYGCFQMKPNGEFYYLVDSTHFITIRILENCSIELTSYIATLLPDMTSTMKDISLFNNIIFHNESLQIWYHKIESNFHENFDRNIKDILEIKNYFSKKMWEEIKYGSI